MKFPQLPVLTAFCLATFSAAHAATYSTDFTGFTLNQPVAGQDDWMIDDPTPDASYIMSVTGWGRVATLGYVFPLNNSSVYLSHAANTPLVGATFSVKFQVQDSTNDGPARDTFGFRLENGSGQNLFSFYLNPYDQDADPEDDYAYHTFAWSSSSTAPTVLLPGVAAEETKAYTLTVAFALSGANDVTFTGDVNGSAFSGVIPGLAAESIQELGAFWTPLNGPEDPGTNFLIFDNISLVPEPSAALLGLAGISLSIIRRRR